MDKFRQHLVWCVGVWLTLGSFSACASCFDMLVLADKGSHLQPENSVSAVKAAFDGSWDGATIDIQPLRSKQWVLHHDPLTGRTTSLAKRQVWDLQSTAWDEVLLKDRKGKITSEKAAYLADVLGNVKERSDKVLAVGITISTKQCGPVQEAVSLLKDSHPGGNWFFTAFDRHQLECARMVDPKGYMGQLVPERDPKNRRQALETIDLAALQRLKQEVGDPVGVHVDIQTLAANPLLLANAKSLGVSVFTFYTGADNELAQAIKNQSRASGLLPSGVIVKGSAEGFCEAMKR